MNLLYIIFTLVMDTGPYNPVGHPALPPCVPPSVPMPTASFNNFQTKFLGADNRYPVGYYPPDEFMKIANISDSFEKLQLVQKIIFIEDIKRDQLINEILKTDDIKEINIKSGGLFDDWERNI